ncbi:hypothetical protein [Rubrimonas cliftonensis]|uniref:Type II secretion system protein GspC N-terminal domain-containing protein n=1 Tax=Rubrimonas cliftonensis TaxID=89524 RepID=A0A1H3WSI6_9RHOB|nr:hypothetical protein [Rubrimonas cliftonensis]SDZ89304.1 hypothetical protein SAMN05444370_10272 [Rubrimonas cliftonensis]
MLRMILLNMLVWGAAAFAAAGLARVAAAPPVERAPARVSLSAPLEVEAPRRPGPDAFAAIAERPLFSPSRRPPAVVASAGAAPDGPPPPLALIGVVGGGQTRVALARTSGAQISGGRADETLRLRPGDVVDGWTVAEIAERAITLERGGERRSVALGDAAPDVDAALDGPLSAPSGAPARATARARRPGRSNALIGPDGAFGLEPGEYLGAYDD